MAARSPRDRSHLEPLMATRPPPNRFRPLTGAVLVFAWDHQSVGIQSAILSIGWPVLYLITVLQTIFMVKKLVRRQRGFTPPDRFLVQGCRAQVPVDAPRSKDSD